jgi:hypothetical protein
LDHADKEFFDIILDKVGWTSEAPSEEERRLGWMSFDEFRKWLRKFFGEVP